MDFVRATKTQKALVNRIHWMQYLAALLVICVHCGPVLEDPSYNHVLKGAVCRVAVPFFALSTAYFVREKNRQQPNYFRTYLSTSIKNYLVWSLVFLPLGFVWLQQHMKLPPYLYPAAMLVGLFYSGTYYHLWYIPALLFALLLVHVLVRRYKYKVLVIGFGLLYLFGCLETYYGFLSEGWLQSFFDGYIQVFVTTRNGLLFLSIFVVLGFLISDYQEQLHHYSQYYSGGLVVSISGLILEERLIFQSGNLDMNFLISLLPFSFCVFLWGLNGSSHSSRLNLKKLSSYYYFIHPLALTLMKLLTQQSTTNGWLRFLLTVLLTHGLSLVVSIGRKKISKSYLSKL